MKKAPAKAGEGSEPSGFSSRSCDGCAGVHSTRYAEQDGSHDTTGDKRGGWCGTHNDDRPFLSPIKQAQNPVRQGDYGRC